MIIKTIKLFLILSLFSSTLFASAIIELDSELSNQELTPIIKINHVVVMRVKGKGPTYMHFPSNFARAQRIYSLLIDLSEKGFDIQNIKLKRRKSEYSGEIKGLRVFTITQGDLEGTGKTTYEMGKFWVTNIKTAVNRSTDTIPSSNDYIKDAQYPFLHILNLLGTSKLIYILIQIIVIITLQMVICYFLIRKLDSRVLIAKQMEKIEDALSSQQIHIQRLKEEISELKKQPPS